MIVLFIAIQIRRARLSAYVTAEDISTSYQLEVLDQSAGVFQGQGKQFILDGGNLALKKRLIDSLKLLALPAGVVVDLTYRNQVIVRGVKNDSI